MQLRDRFAAESAEAVRLLETHYARERDEDCEALGDRLQRQQRDQLDAVRRAAEQQQTERLRESERRLRSEHDEQLKQIRDETEVSIDIVSESLAFECICVFSTLDFFICSNLICPSLLLQCDTTRILDELKSELELARRQARSAADELRRSARAQAEAERLAARQRFDVQFCCPHHSLCTCP